MYVHGDSIKEETIVALRLVKYYLCKVGGALKVKITTKLLDLVKTGMKLIWLLNGNWRKNWRRKNNRIAEEVGMKSNGKMVAKIK